MCRGRCLARVEVVVEPQAPPSAGSAPRMVDPDHRPPRPGEHPQAGDVLLRDGCLLGPCLHREAALVEGSEVPGSARRPPVERQRAPVTPFVRPARARDRPRGGRSRRRPPRRRPRLVERVRRDEARRPTHSLRRRPAPTAEAVANRPRRPAQQRWSVPSGIWNSSAPRFRRPRFTGRTAHEAISSPPSSVHRAKVEDSQNPAYPSGDAVL